MSDETKTNLELFLEEMVANEDGLLSDWQLWDLKRSIKLLDFDLLKEVTDDEEE